MTSLQDNVMALAFQLADAKVAHHETVRLFSNDQAEYDEVKRLAGEFVKAEQALRDALYKDEVLQEAHELMPFFCAECGTKTASTFVVTTLDYGDVKGTRTEVCRACDDGLRLGPVVESFQKHAQDIAPDRDPEEDDIESVEDMEADTWVAAAIELAAAL